MSTSSSTNKILQFVPFNSSIDPTFWHALTQLKIDILKLGDEPVGIQGWYERGRWTVERDQSSSSQIINQVSFGNEFRVDGKSLSSAAQSDQTPQTSSMSGRVPVWGMLKNFNTIEEFKACDKQNLFNTFSDQLWKDKIENKEIPSEDKSPEFLNLKKYKYYYWFTFPAFVSKPSWNVILPNQNEEDWPTLAVEDTLELNNLILQNNNLQNHYWIAKRDQTSNSWSLASISQWIEFFKDVSEENRYLIFIDPAVHPQAAGWPLRNILARIQSQYGNQARKFKVIGYRDPIGVAENHTVSIVRSVLVTIELPEQEIFKVSYPPYSKKDKKKQVFISSHLVSGRLAAVGWEKNAAGKLGPRMADLAPMMDPIRLAEQAVDLNLKLMRWRILPDLNLRENFFYTLFTIRCRNTRLLHSAKVSFSNPVRQPLFEFEDCLEGGKPKAACASAALKRIYPGLDTEGIELSIPMPGHPIPPNLIDQTKAQVDQLESLFDTHDVVYLFMDSRESRWLPTLLGARSELLTCLFFLLNYKLVINAALGFDSYLVMRHGVRSSTPTQSDASSTVTEENSASSKLPQIRQLGCYFCNDVVAPSDSLTDRTLDQMCTVTRPGLAPIASATAVELMASVLQHPQGIEVLAEIMDKNRDEHKSTIQESVLGLVPHQIRGFLSKFDNLKLVGPAYDKCTGCSLTKNIRNLNSNVIQAFNDSKYLENLTLEVNLESLEWDDEEEEGEE
ncbi:hypothetical protein PSHT_06602 [Puccinia striiformis]|uniref:Ubiquitin-like modifier-activating enzyme ATG7 n=1 Tax=Puccinia striiformis TaxID=27350 RepID=A0A2S4W450_9BASI|nr:hypothetical protein PSHT_06602 [Puccinia striiformis]